MLGNLGRAYQKSLQDKSAKSILKTDAFQQQIADVLYRGVQKRFETKEICEQILKKFDEVVSRNKKDLLQEELRRECICVLIKKYKQTRVDLENIVTRICKFADGPVGTNEKQLELNLDYDKSISSFTHFFDPNLPEFTFYRIIGTPYRLADNLSKRKDYNQSNWDV